MKTQMISPSEGTLATSFQNRKARTRKSLDDNSLPEVLFITSFPPRECGIATYSQDLLRSVNNKFGHSFSLKVCALETGSDGDHVYTDEVKFVLDTTDSLRYRQLASLINADHKIKSVLVQHEFGFFENNEGGFRNFLSALKKPVVIVFHTVLQHPDESLKIKVQQLASSSESVVVMTNYSADVLVNDYHIERKKIQVIPHGTHLVPHSDKLQLKEKYRISGRKILSTFGLLSAGKSIETTLEALPEIINRNPDVLFLIIGKTHPSVMKQEGEKYRSMLEEKAEQLQLGEHVKFINQFLPLNELLEYLQLTDIYLFTSKDPNQAVSGTFSYAISCGCPVVSTPIPHAREVLRDDAGIIFDFESPKQLSSAVITLLADEQLRKNISSNGLHRIASTSWENSAIAHALLFAKTESDRISLKFNIPVINLDHVRKLTTDFGILQFSKINKPDLNFGYTLDDNARALIAMCMHYELTTQEEDLGYIRIYLDFIKHCIRTEGYFLNYVDREHRFTRQNDDTNIADANGRAMWALGYLISKGKLLPVEMVTDAEEILERAISRAETMHSTRAIAFTIKGLYCFNLYKKPSEISALIKMMANRLVQMYRHEAEADWNWFESYLTYANGVVPDALLCAWQDTGETVFKETARASFDFLLSHIFKGNRISVISNQNWLHKGQETISIAPGGEQPIDVAYTILALSRFYDVFKEKGYKTKIETAFNWFLGNNHLHQIIYNPCTGGCYDGLEENYINLNQGAESTLSYLLARLTVEKHFPSKHNK
jgi:glycosyltransferase involved in cell wall biosynthesis